MEAKGDLGVKVNIKKISELSGFSPATVSNALNNKRGVNRDTAERIIRIAHQYGYITANKIRSIKLVTYRDSGEVFSDSPFFAALLEGVENESRKSGYETAIFNLYRRQPDYKERVAELLNDTTSAILLIGTELSEQDAIPFQQAEVPLVLLDCWFDHLSFNAVLMNNQDSVCQAVNHLIDLGHQRIGYLQGKVRIRNFECRERGYRQAMAEHGLSVEDRYIFTVPPSISGAYEAMNQMLQAKPELPTAFFADNDMIALGAMQALQKNGYRVPDEISILGFDDITFCEVFNPPLSTIRVYKQELGQLAVQKLIELIHSKTKLRVRTQICNELIKRGSIAPPQNE